MNVKQNQHIDLQTHTHTTTKHTYRTLISGFRHNVDEIRALLGYYAVSCGNCLLMFQDNVLVPSSRCPEMSVNNYHTTPRNIPDERRSHT